MKSKTPYHKEKKSKVEKLPTNQRNRIKEFHEIMHRFSMGEIDGEQLTREMIAFREKYNVQKSINNA